MVQNVCHFIPFHKDLHSIHTINFVLETKKQTDTTLKTESVYKMYYVNSGKGYLHTPGRQTELQRGDVFFTFPAFPFSIESAEDFQYMYISFVGLRGNMIMEKLGLSNTCFVFPGMNSVESFWETGIRANPSVIEWMSESVLLYTFSTLGDLVLSEEDRPNQQKAIHIIKKYIDDHFTERNFSLDDMSSQLSYNKKYISSVFKKQVGIGIAEYVNTIRIQNACNLIKQGFSSVADVAWRSGYSDAQYFSRVFKVQIGISPTQYIKDVQQHNEE